MGSRYPRIQAKQKHISLISFEKRNSKLMGSRDPRILEKARQISVTTFKEPKSKHRDPGIQGSRQNRDILV